MTAGASPGFRSQARASVIIRRVRSADHAPSARPYIHMEDFGAARVGGQVLDPALGDAGSLLGQR
eukprot:11219349-Lingulodinium_polyedra.AAC.1